MKRYKSSLKEGSNYYFAQKEFTRVLSDMDEYGARIQVTSNKGKTKWLNLDSDVADALRDILKNRGL